METKECGNCFHWELTAGAVQHGDCLAMPPRVFLLHDGSFETLFPVLAANERCGWWRTKLTEAEMEAEHKAGLEHEEG